MIPQTTIIGSYPLFPNRGKIMQNYFHHSRNDIWNPLIQKVLDDLNTAGIDIFSDGQTRDPFIQLFARKLKGCRLRNRVEIIDDIGYSKPITVDDQRYIQSIIPPEKQLKGVITGPYTLAKSCIDLYYHDEQEVAFSFAHALRNEVEELQSSIDILGIDEPFFSVSFPEYAQDLIDILTKNISLPTLLHVCGNVSSVVPKIFDLPVDTLSHEFKARPDLFDVFHDFSYPQSLCIGCVRSDDIRIESVQEITSHIKHALDLFGDKIQYLSPDCGQRSLPRDVAYHKLDNLVQAKEASND
jgi:5-methyltetrahydropteroyltriglutamate--homocysteine methyltransferase